MRKLEEETRKAEAQRREQDRLEAAKRKEMQRITNERRQEEQRRRTQEIKLSREEMERLPLNMNGAASGSNVSSVSTGAGVQGSVEGSPRFVKMLMMNFQFESLTFIILYLLLGLHRGSTCRR